MFWIFCNFLHSKQSRAVIKLYKELTNMHHWVYINNQKSKAVCKTQNGTENKKQGTEASFAT